jgi:hypothetical protein
MERRREVRTKRRLSCEFFVDGDRHTGIVVDLSASGLFLRTDAGLDPGTALEVHLDGARFPRVTIHTVVARRRRTPALLSSVLHRGLGLRITHAPEEYYAALEGNSELSQLDIEVVVQADPAGSAPDTAEELPVRAEPEAADAALPVDPAAPAQPANGEVMEFVEPTPEPRAEPPDTSASRPSPQGVEDEPETAPREAAAPRLLDGWVSPATPYPSLAIMVDDGELDDVHELLTELGANPVRHLGKDPAGFRGWVSVPRVFVTTARCALALRLPTSTQSQGVVPIAVAKAESQVLVNLLRRQGFRYVVRRPVHPEALRLLLLRSLYRDPEHRSELRIPLGCEVSWRSGWRKRRGMLVEISSSGCRLLSPVAVEPASRVTLWVPKAVAGGRSLRLSGRVVRFERLGSDHRLGQVALAITFDPLGARLSERLNRLLAERASGPIPLPRNTEAQPEPPVEPTVDEAAAPSRTVEEPSKERRQHKRAVLEREVVTLDADSQVHHVLVGRDLAEGGLRVELHPELEVGVQLRVALYDASAPEPLVIDAEVTREDGARGLLLRFVEPRRSDLRRLRGIVDALPEVEDLRTGDQEARRVVLAGIVTRRRVV